MEGMKEVINKPIPNIKIFPMGVLGTLKNGLSKISIDKKELKDEGKFFKDKLTDDNVIDNCIDKVGKIFETPNKKKKGKMNLDY